MSEMFSQWVLCWYCHVPLVLQNWYYETLMISDRLKWIMFTISKAEQFKDYQMMKFDLAWSLETGTRTIHFMLNQNKRVLDKVHLVGWMNEYYLAISWACRKMITRKVGKHSLWKICWNTFNPISIDVIKWAPKK